MKSNNIVRAKSRTSLKNSLMKAVIFDFDGLLVNSEELRELSIKNFLEKYGKTFNHSDYRKTVIGSRNEVTIFLKKEYELPGSIEKLTSERRKFFDQLYKEKLVLMEGVLELLKNIKKWRIVSAVATGRGKDEVLDGLKRLGILDFFKVIVTADDVSNRKPDPQSYLLTAEKLKIEPTFCLALEDSPHGVESAKSAGMKVIYVPSARYFDDWHDDADIIVKSLHEVTDDIFNKLAK